MNLSQQESQRFILVTGQQIEILKWEIVQEAKRKIFDFDWLKHKVSTVWECEASPIGMCVFDTDDYLEETNCRYCKQPKVRK